MTFDEYAQTHKYAKYPPGIIYPALAISGEAGEYSEKIAKLLRDHPEYWDGFKLKVPDHIRMALAKELGDILWNVQANAHELGFTLQQIADMNKHKLDSRAERGTLQGSGDNR